MTMRFVLLNVAITTAGTALVHGLTSDRGTTPVTPNEWHWVNNGAPARDVEVYRSAGPTTTNITLCCSSAAAAAVDVFVSYNYSTIR